MRWRSVQSAHALIHLTLAPQPIKQFPLLSLAPQAILEQLLLSSVVLLHESLLPLHVFLVDTLSVHLSLVDLVSVKGLLAQVVLLLPLLHLPLLRLHSHLGLLPHLSLHSHLVLLHHPHLHVHLGTCLRGKRLSTVISVPVRSLACSRFWSDVVDGSDMPTLH